MQEDRTISIQQIREDLRKVEERFAQWQQGYLDYQHMLEELHLQQAYFDLLMKTWERPYRRSHVNETEE